MPSIASTCHSIQRREEPRDRYFTPPKVVDLAIEMVGKTSNEEVWWEPFCGDGAYYNKYPLYSRKTYTEIDQGLDAFAYNGPADIVCTNPPYSCLTKVFKMLAEKKPRVVQLLIGVMNLTIPRRNLMEASGYTLTKLHQLDIKGWFGTSIIVQWEILPPTTTPPAVMFTHTPETFKTPCGGGWVCKERKPDIYINHGGNWVEKYMSQYND